MLVQGKDSFGQLFIGAIPVSSVYLGIKKGALLLWEAISNCLAGGWWQDGHGWQYGIGWSQKQNNTR